MNKIKLWFKHQWEVNQIPLIVAGISLSILIVLIYVLWFIVKYILIAIAVIISILVFLIISIIIFNSFRWVYMRLTTERNKDWWQFIKDWE